jgi:3'-phosphoadenosine 5'-phosphosulfate sulfotransferase (PAPS reductase)/FAD synthetase
MEAIENLYSRKELIRLQKLPFESKMILTKARIRQFYSLCHGKVYVSFSGGKDSTVLLHLVRSIYPDVKGVFCDTGLEFPEIREFVKSFNNIEIIKPERTFKTIIEEKGYPIISKEVAHAVDQIRRGCKGYVKRFNGEVIGRNDYRKYSYLLNAPFKISDQCCNEMKKKPFHKFNKRSGLRPMLGMMAQESFLRTQQWQLHGCINSRKGDEIANPMAFWTESDIYTYVKKYNICLAPPYLMGYKRTGCVFCLFGAQSEKYPNRIQRLQRTHPKLYNYCMSEKGLDMKKVCEFIGLEYIDPNARIEDFVNLVESQSKSKGD